MDLGEVLKTYLSNDQQGQLVIKFAGEDHLCKISIENGQAVYMTLGTKGPAEALETIVGKVADWSNFIKGLQARKRLENPLNQQLLKIAGLAPPAVDEIRLKDSTETTAVIAGEIAGEAKSVAPSKIQEVNRRFTDLVGPIAFIIIKEIYTNLAYIDGAPMNSATYIRFIGDLAAEVPERQQQAFIEASK
jgi:hypothetical protein